MARPWADGSSLLYLVHWMYKETKMTVKFTKITSFAFTLLLLLAALTGVLTSCSPAGTRDNDLVINERSERAHV